MADKSGPQSVLWALFSLKGRVRRATFGLGIAMVFSLWWVALAQVFATQEGTERHDAWLISSGLIAIGSTYCLYALCHKRIQDLGHPGYYALIVIIASPVLSGFLFIPLGLLAFLKGQPERNKFGPPPVS